MFSLRKNILVHQLLAFALICFAISGPLFAVDIISLEKFHEMVPEDTIDLLASIRYLRYIPSDDPRSIEAVNRIEQKLNGYDFIKKYVEINEIFWIGFNVEDEQNGENLTSSIVGVRPEDLSFLKITIKKGALAENAVCVREDLFFFKSMKINETKIRIYSIIIDYDTGKTYTEYCTTLVVSGIFSANSSNAFHSSTPLLLSTMNTVEMIAKCSEASGRDPFFLKTYVADIDNSIIDPLNPETSEGFLYSLERGFGGVRIKDIALWIDVPLYSKVHAYVVWKNDFRMAMLYANLPTLLSLSIIGFFFMETHKIRWKREFDVLIARGFSKSIGHYSAIKVTLLNAILGFVVGLIGGLPYSYVYCSTIVFAVSYHTIIYIISFYVAPVTFCIALYVIFNLYKDFIAKFSKLGKGIFRKFVKFTEKDAFFLTLMVYSCLVLFIVISNSDFLLKLMSDLVFDLRHGPFYYQVIYLSLVMIFGFAPIAFLIGIIIIWFKLTKSLIRGVSSLAKFHKKLRFALLGLRNAYRKSTEIKLLAFIFSIITMFSASSLLIANSYLPNLYAYEYWLTSGDVAVYFVSESNVTRLNEMLNDITSGVDGIEVATMVLSRTYSLARQYRHFVLGIIPNDFIKVYKTADGNSIENTSLAEKIKELSNKTGFGLISESFKREININEGDIITYVNSWEERMISVRIIGSIDEEFPQTLILPALVAEEIEKGSKGSIAVTFRCFYKGYIRVPVIEYIITDVTTVLNIFRRVGVVFIFKIAKNADKISISAEISNKINLLKEKYPELLDSHIRDTESIVANKMSNEKIRGVNTVLLAGSVMSSMMVLIILYEIVEIQKKKRTKDLIILSAIGESRTQIAGIVFTELLTIFIFGIVIGSITGIITAVELSVLVNIRPSFIFGFLMTSNFLTYYVINVIFLTLGMILFALIIICQVRRINIPKYLKIEWSSEEIIAGEIWSG